MRLAPVFLIFLIVGLAFHDHATGASTSLPADLVGHYEILQRRILALTNGRGYVLQDGALVTVANIQSSRPYCRANLSSFDDYNGQINIHFEVDTLQPPRQRALIQTIPSRPTHRPLTIECFADSGFNGALDLSIALGRVVGLSIP